MKETKFLMFFSALMELLASCSRCLAPCTLSTIVLGTFLSVKELCTSCGHLCTWNSQPCIGKGVLPAGYLLLSASILYAGASPTQVLRTCTGVPIRSHHHTASICQIPVTLSHAISIKSVGNGQGSTHCRGSEQMLATKPWGRWT